VQPDRVGLLGRLGDPRPNSRISFRNKHGHIKRGGSRVRGPRYDGIEREVLVDGHVMKQML